MVRGDHERLGGLCEDHGAWQAAGDLDEHQGHLRDAVSREGRMITDDYWLVVWNIFLIFFEFSPRVGMMIESDYSDQYFSEGLKPPTRLVLWLLSSTEGDIYPPSTWVMVWGNQMESFFSLNHIGCINRSR